jgi:tRNA(Ile)-lysidine synthase
MSQARQRNLLRHWIETNGLPIPALAVLDQIVGGALSARRDANPCVEWPGAQVRRYHGRLYAMATLPPADSGASFAWNIGDTLPLPDGSTLGAIAAIGSGLRAAAGARLEVRFRQGGEVLQPAGRRGHHTLKKLLQEWQVPDWERSRVPLVFSKGVLVAVAGFCVCEGFQALAGESGYVLYWNSNADSAAVPL